MFIIMVYDVNVKRVNKVLKLARKYLNWVQNSVLEGDITDAKFFKLKSELQKIINKEEDSVIFYTFRSKLYTSREVIGKEKGSLDFIL
jgi:CRISPR-associated protein Cas2